VSNLVGMFLAQVPGASKYFVSIRGDAVSTVKAPRILKPQKMGNYLGLTITCDSGQQRRVYLHRLMLESWVRFAQPGEEARHLDGDPHNNALVNLDWGTALDNAKDKALHGSNCDGDANGMAKLTTELVCQMRLLKGTQSYAAIAARFGVSSMTAYRAINHISWRKH
jgi:hypothetical protein